MGVLNFGLLALFFPFFGFIFSSFFSNRLGSRGVASLTTFSLFLSFIFSLVVFYQVLVANTSFHTTFGVWFYGAYFYSSWGFLFDPLAALMLVVVTSVSFCVHFYSIEYMHGDPHQARFMGYLSLFTFFMLLLVTADNLVQLFLGWEGIGLCSYLLIGFWFTRPAAAQSALKAMLVNRIGDLGLMVAIALAVYYVGTTDFFALLLLAPDFAHLSVQFFGAEISFISFFSFFLVLGAIGKSAQIGLHTWLPDAMEGPTPVSALIHAATLVTAGVFLICRFSFLLELSPSILFFISVVGIITAFMGATIGLFQYDIKRVIAYSTCSQLGYMFFACGTSNYDLALFHLYNHAYFKALLFLCAGSVIHAMMDEQDIRRMGGLYRFLPFTYVAMLLGTLSLCGFPYFSGFYSKDLIVEASFQADFHFSSLVYWLALFTTFFSSFYSFRLLYLVFFSFPAGYRSAYSQAAEPSFYMSFPLFCLSGGALFSGYLASDVMVGLGTDFWAGSLFVLPEHMVRFDAEFSFFYLRVSTFLASLIGALASLVLHIAYPGYLFQLNFFPRFRALFLFLNKKWCFDALYNGLVVRPGLVFAYESVLSSFDRGILEHFGPTFFSSASSFLFHLTSLTHSGYIYHYLALFFLGLFLLLAALFLGQFFSLLLFFFVGLVTCLVLYLAVFFRPFF